MKNLTKQEQVDEAYKAYRAIVNLANEAYLAIDKPAWKAHLAIADPARKAYEAKVEEINAQPDKVETVITHNGRKYKLVENK